MVTIVIVSILIAVAVPTYKSQIRKSRRTDAKTALLDLAAREERYYSTGGTSSYTGVAANLGYSGAWPIQVGSGYYQISNPTGTITPATATAPASFTLTAVPVPGSDQAKDLACAQFLLTSTGVQTATGSDPNANTDCWQ